MHKRIALILSITTAIIAATAGEVQACVNCCGSIGAFKRSERNIVSCPSQPPHKEEVWDFECSNDAGIVTKTWSDITFGDGDCPPWPQCSFRQGDAQCWPEFLTPITWTDAEGHHWEQKVNNVIMEMDNFCFLFRCKVIGTNIFRQWCPCARCETCEGPCK